MALAITYAYALKTDSMEEVVNKVKAKYDKLVEMMKRMVAQASSSRNVGENDILDNFIGELNLFLKNFVRAFNPQNFYCTVEYGRLKQMNDEAMKVPYPIKSSVQPVKKPLHNYKPFWDNNFQGIGRSQGFTPPNFGNKDYTNMVSHL
ncbi:unnamed protein product [Amaranthus hypochondriacus]